MLTSAMSFTKHFCFLSVDQTTVERSRERVEVEGGIAKLLSNPKYYGLKCAFSEHVTTHSLKLDQYSLHTKVVNKSNLTPRAVRSVHTVSSNSVNPKHLPLFLIAGTSRRIVGHPH